MKSRHLGAAVAILLLFAAFPAYAQPDGAGCFVGRGLGATLLYPHFEADLNDFNGPATLISINNGLANDALVRVTLWTDWGNPTMAFDVYLSGFRVQTLNLRDTMNGGVPSTGEEADLSAFENCDVNPPFHDNPALTADEIAQLQADHTGQLGPLADNCAGSPHDDGIARGYITVDVVDECRGVEGFDPFFTPVNTETPYFSNGDGTGIAIDENRLWGDIFYLSNNEASAHGSPAVALWADADAFDAESQFTFYGRFSGWDTRDNRVPLPRAWSQRFINGGPFAGGADLLIYQDTGVGRTFADCGTTPEEFPLDALLFAIADTGTDNILDFSDSYGDFAGLATQRASISTLGIPFAFGWTQLDAGLSQVWVQPTLLASGIYSASLDGTALAFLCSQMPPSVAPPEPEASSR